MNENDSKGLKGRVLPSFLSGSTFDYPRVATFVEPMMLSERRHRLVGMATSLFHSVSFVNVSSDRDMVDE